MNQSINQSINPSIDQLINQLALESEAYIVFRRPGAHPGGRLGASPRPTARVVGTPTAYQLRLKIAPFFDAVFLQFLVDLGGQDAPKIHKNPSKTHFKFALDFYTVFDIIFYQFLLDFRSPGTPKIKLKRCSVVIFYTFSDFRLGSLLESILADFGIDFGRLLASIFAHFREKGVSKKSSKFHIDFYTFFVDFRLQVEPQP